MFGPIEVSEMVWTYSSFRNYDVESFNHELKERLGDLKFSGNRDVNEMYETFTNTLYKVTDKYAPLKKEKNVFLNLCHI